MDHMVITQPPTLPIYFAGVGIEFFVTFQMVQRVMSANCICETESVEFIRMHWEAALIAALLTSLLWPVCAPRRYWEKWRMRNVPQCPQCKAWLLDEK